MPDLPARLASPLAGAPDRRRRLVRWATLLACCAVLISAGWGLAMWMVASALRPAQLNSATYTAQVPVAASVARMQMQLILLSTFAVLVVLAALAILVGRRALRLRVSAQVLAQFGTSAVWTLVGGLVVGILTLLLLYSAATHFDRFPELPFDLLALPIGLMMAGAMGSLILSGLVVRQTPAGVDQPAAQRTGWRVGARICLLVAPLLLLAGFLFISLLAEFIAAFYLHLVG